MLFLVRYGEIGLKSSQVRRRLRDRLITNIQDDFLNEGAECITSGEEGRVFVRSEEMDKARYILSRTFGVVSFSPVWECCSDKDDIIQKVLEVFDQDLREGTTFAVRARRSGEHFYTSQELASNIGSAVQSKFSDLKVDLENPNLVIYVEVRSGNTYIYRDIIDGPGGLPLGSQGKVIGYVDGIDAAVSCWLMMKRGCKVHFAHTDQEAIIRILEGWDPRPRSHIIQDENEIYELARKLRAQGLVLGKDVDSIEPKRDGNLAIFYPIIGLSGETIHSIADRIGLEHYPHEES